MNEQTFFSKYNCLSNNSNTDFYYLNKEIYTSLLNNIPDLPLSNIYVASKLSTRLPKDSTLYISILNTLRSWNFFETENCKVCSNVGGFGIDGILSTLVGASLAEPEKICFAVIGDLAFFYDMNVAASGLVGNNVRLLIINNGLGAEFRLYNHPANAFGEAANPYMAAAGHNGNKSQKVMRDYVTDLGFEYLTASSKEEYVQNMERFLSPSLSEKPVLFEVFTSSDDESESLRIMEHLAKDTKTLAKKRTAIKTTHTTGSIHA